MVGHGFFQKGLLDKVENYGGLALSIGDEVFCASLNWTGQCGVSEARPVDVSDPEAYAEEVRQALRMAPTYMGLQSPPDRHEVYDAILVALSSRTLSMIAIALPSKTKEEFFDKAGRLASGLRIEKNGINVIFGATVSKEFRAAG
jgi:hypothetical protein